MTNRDYIMNISVKDFINEYCLPVGYTEEDFVRLMILFKADNEKIHKWLDGEMIGGRKLTNAERIKSMSLEEMAAFVEAAGRNTCHKICVYRQGDENCKKMPCETGIKHWLESESE